MARQAWRLHQPTFARRCGYALFAGLTLVCIVGCETQGIPDAVVAAAPAGDVDATGDKASPEERIIAARVQRLASAESSPSSPSVPSWAADAVFYQLFPERFANGDKSNDPTRESLEAPEFVPENWAISSWTNDWYARADWEKQLGPNFFEHGVFHRRYGGDLQGVIDKLDYLARLGVNTIYFNPVFYARSLHKYDGNSYHHVDPHFGPNPKGDFELMAKETSDPASWHWTEADKLFLELIRQAHERKIRVIVDGVFNHTGRDFFAFADLRKRQADSPYRDWYIVQGYDDPATPHNEFRYKGWWGVDSLPEFSDNEAGSDLHPGPKQYVFDSTTRWMDPNGDGDPSDGIDGWRLDVANEVPTGFWREWHAHARKVNPDCYTVAEYWDNARRFLEEAEFSATMNYHGFAFPVKGFLIDRVLPPSGAARELDARRNGHSRPVQNAVQNLMDSHDTDRLASMIVNAGRRPYAKADRYDYDTNVSPRYVPEYDVRKPNDVERRVQRLIALLQMTYVGPPMIYYGTEAGMWGADDPCDRMPMVWPELTYDAQQLDPNAKPRQADAVKFDEGLFNFYRAAIALRRESSALRRGEIEFVVADDSAQFLGFRRCDDNETLLVGLNRGDDAFRWKIPLDDDKVVARIFTASGDVGQIKIDAEDHAAIVTVPPVDGVVLRISPKE
ncbi:MAG: glycoside hydrolase family 13 protein [Planctomycetes bacterium]|nr:glycoside hydrolase family 13 protein [Planctomycetota bacterium]